MVVENFQTHEIYYFTILNINIEKQFKQYCKKRRQDAYTGCLYVDGVIKFTTMATILIVNRQNQKMPFLLEIACNGYEA